MKTIEWVDGKLRMIDQSKLPLREEFFECADHRCVAEAIKTMRIRGAPAIGVAAAFGIALGARNSSAGTSSELIREIEVIAEILSKTRPTAVNLFWAIERMKRAVFDHKDLEVEQLKSLLEREAIFIAREDAETCRRMGVHGSILIEDGDNILTHCNAGALATTEYGTALGVVRAAHGQGKRVHVYADETRPLLQGARLTAWELMKEDIPVTLITDSMAGFLMSRGRVDKVLVGADRIASNGDTANKIGTYTLAVLAKENEIPLYVVAPMSTIDFNIFSGEEIVIEERDSKEVTRICGKRIAPEAVPVFNPAFDVMPNRYITAIVTEKGIARGPYAESLRNLLSRQEAGGKL